MNPQYAEALTYFIRERDTIRRRKEFGEPKPWSPDKVFQQTYFCNVRREDDKVTKWIRRFYNQFAHDPMLEYNIILSRFINKPETLDEIGYQYQHDPDRIESIMSQPGKWGSAYVVTTHGIPMGKGTYLARRVLPAAYGALSSLRSYGAAPALGATYHKLLQLEGLGSFMAAQIIADLKHTFKHPLQGAADWWEFVAPGPGSLKGLAWFHHGDPDLTSRSRFPKEFYEMRRYVDANWPIADYYICNQDLQNCLCEFDKYCRVSTGIGRSKRGYKGL